MKKILATAFLLALLAALSLPCFAQDEPAEPEKIRIKGAKFGLSLGYYYKGADELSKELYGAGNLMYGAYLGFDIAWRFELRAEKTWFNDKGESTITKKELLFSMNQIMLGARFRILGNEKITPYLGAGFCPGNYIEEVPEVSHEFSGKLEKTSYFEAGLYLKLKGRFYVDVNIRSIKADVEPLDEVLHFGGTKAGIGIEYRF